MPLDLAQKAQDGPSRVALTDRISPHWRRPLLHLTLGWTVLLVLLWPVLADMLRQFWNSSTYNHNLFVPLICGWLVWLRVPELVRIAPQGWWPGLVLLGGALFLWLLGDVSGTAIVTHFALVFAMQAMVLLVLGPRVVWALLFPLAYALFLVPVGDELVPTLQMITADLTIALTHWSGIPAEIEGVFIDTPAGLFEVAEACSGVKFLVAMAALGSLAAHVCFISGKRRTVFMAVALVLPILANGVRAWGTIFIAQSQGVEFAAGFDHVFYGWIFFALVMALLLACAWPFFDRPRDDVFIDGDAIQQAPAFAMLDAFAATSGRCLAAAVLLAFGVFAWAVQARQVEAVVPERIDLPQVAGWRLAPLADGPWWEPRAAGADHRLLGSYVAPDGARVEVFYALYRSQQDGREATAFGEGALMPDSGWSWLESGPSLPGGQGEWLLTSGTVRRLAMTFYRHRDLTTASAARIKLGNMQDRLTGDPHPTMVLILSAQGGGPVDPERAISRFAAATGGLDGWMDHLGQTR
jgi:exosortase A